MCVDPLSQILHLTEGSCLLTLGQLLTLWEHLKKTHLGTICPCPTSNFVNQQKNKPPLVTYRFAFLPVIQKVALCMSALYENGGSFQELT